MAWVIYLGMQELHPDSESWLAEWGRVLSLPNAMSAIEQGEAANLVTLLPHGEEIEAYGALEQWLREHTSNHCTLVYPQPAMAIAQQLQQGGELEAACQHWKQQAQALLSLFRQHRRQLSLLSWPAAANTAEGETADPVPLPKHAASHAIEPVYSLLARQALSQEADLAEAARFLAAATHNAAQCQAAGPDLSVMLESHRQEQQQRHDRQAQSEELKALRDERDGLSTQLKETEEENTLLLEQLHYVQEELERYILDHRAQSKQNTDLQQVSKQQELLLQWLRAFATRTNCALYKKHPALLKKHKAQLASSASFDADWYARTYPDVAEGGIEPEVHYLKFGMLEGRNPSAEFNTRHYITAHPDIAAAGEHPLLHYIRWGRDEQRQALPQPLAEESR
ncbi:MAG: hypothetical protein ACQEXO_17535 [Pseudomonadota bacterium]